jgi:hypothetical protein
VADGRFSYAENSSVVNVETAEFASRRFGIRPLIADKAPKSLANFFEKAADISRRAFGYEFDPAVGQVADVARHFVVACD